MEKIINNENKEGFEHKGNGFIAGKSKQKEEERERDKPDSDWVITIKAAYNIAALVAIMLIKMPYKFLNQGINLILRFVNNINQMLKPMYAFAKQMFKIVQRVVKQFYDIFMNIFKQGFDILMNLPAFIQQYATIGINMISMIVTQGIDMMTNFANLFQNIFNSLLALPQKFFNIMNQMSTLMFNMFNMLLDLPEKGLNAAIGFQGTLMSMMDRPLKIPFSDQFLG